MADEIVIADVVRDPNGSIKVGERFTIQLTVSGGVSGFFFPFSNESLTEKLIEFIKVKEDGNGR